MNDFCKVKKLVKLYVTPKMLRNWADRMEAKWPKLVVGDSIVWNDFCLDQDTELHICYDQERMGREENVQ